MEELDLKTIFSSLWKKKLYIIVVTLVFVVVGAVYSFKLKTPMYKSITQVVLVNSTAEGEGVTQSDVTLNTNLVATYSVIIKSNSILEKVIETLNIQDMTVEDIEKSIIVKSVNNTSVIEISVVNEEPSRAMDISSTLTNVFTEKIQQIYKLDNVTVVSPAKIPTEPYNMSRIKDLGLFGAIGLVLSCVFILVLNIFNNTVKDEEDVERITGLLVLASIPKLTSGSNKGGRY